MSSLLGIAMAVPPSEYSPWVCDYGITDHPHYHDCENCPHNVGCEYGMGKMATLEFNRAVDAYNADVDEYNTQFPDAKAKHMDYLFWGDEHDAWKGLGQFAQDIHDYINADK